jgi:nitroreductase
VVKMNVMEAIRTRKSVRAYEDRPVEDEKLQTVLEAARLAPSASNSQEWRFVVVRDADMRRKLAEAAHNQAFVGEAPVVIAACAESVDRVMACGQPSYPIDVAIAIDHMTLDEAGVKSLLGVPESARVVELLPLGYPADPSVASKKRMDTDEIVRYEKW